MNRAAGRVWLYVTVALLAGGAIAVMRPKPRPRPGEVLTGRVPPPRRERIDSLGSGETITALLGRSGMSDDEVRRALEAAPGIDHRRLRAGMRITVRGPDSVPSEIVLHLGVDRRVRLTRMDGTWSAEEERIPWTTDTMVVEGTIQSNLYDAFDAGGRSLPREARSELAWNVADVFEYRLDMSRDLQPGDEFRVLVERRSTSTGATRIGTVLAVDYASGKERLRVVRFGDVNDKPRYFDESGRSMQAAFLRAPLEFRRISSVFGMRRHPILGVFRSHKGTDYAAASGTPVRSIGDGQVVTAGRMSGFGNVIDVRHPNGMVSRYGHLRAFARGVQRGTRVGIGETIGYVGMTGLATAPHLHFEILVNGVQQNPGVALSNRSGDPISADLRPSFALARDGMFALLDRASADSTRIPPE